MWRKKKFIFTALLTVVVLGGILGGFAVAHADDEDTSQPQTGSTSLLDKVAEIYEKNTGVAIEPQELQKAFTEAGAELKTEARDRLRQRLIDEGKITQEQLDELDKWLESKPAFSTEEFKQWMESRPAFPTEEFKQWLESRPDITLPFGPGNRDGEKPFGGMFRNFREFGKGFGHVFRGWCAPDAPVE